MASKLALSALNASSAKSGGKWVVGVYHPFVDKYAYTWGGVECEGQNFVCYLVSVDNAENYCTAHLKKTQPNATKFNRAEQVYSAGKCFQMSKVGFVMDAKSQYVATPI